MNEDIGKIKLKMQDIINEVTNLKRYNNELGNNIKGEKLENYIDKLNKEIMIAEDNVETIYSKISK